MNFDFTSKYTFSGAVSYEDGSPAVNIDVMATWGDSQNQFMNYDKTDELGHYSISSPFEITTYVGIASIPDYITPRQPYYRNLKAGRDNVNFILKKSSESSINKPSTTSESIVRRADAKNLIKTQMN